MLEEMLLKDEKIIRIFSDPLHQRMLSALGNAGSLTSAGLARLLGGEAGRLHYHLRRMEGAGLIELDHEENINGIRARYMRPAAKSFRIDHTALNASPGLNNHVLDLVKARFDMAMAEMDANVRRMGALSDERLAEQAGWLTDGNFDLSPEDVAALQADIAALSEKYEAISESHKKSGRSAQDAARAAGDPDGPWRHGLVRTRHLLLSITTLQPPPAEGEPST